MRLLKAVKQETHLHNGDPYLLRKWQLGSYPQPFLTHMEFLEWWVVRRPDMWGRVAQIGTVLGHHSRRWMADSISSVACRQWQQGRTCAVLSRGPGSQWWLRHRTVEQWAHGADCIRVEASGHSPQPGGVAAAARLVSGMVSVVPSPLKALDGEQRWLRQIKRLGGWF